MGDPYNNDERRPEVLSDLRTQLREAADSHRPDRERMLRRVEHGMAAPRPAARGGWLGRGGHRSPIGPAPWARVVGVTAGFRDAGSPIWLPESQVPAAASALPHSGTPLTECQRYSPSARRKRTSSSKGSPLATHVSHFALYRSRSSG